MNELFSGIGCQSRGFKNSNLFDIEVINTSDINKESVVSYAAIHCGMTKEMIDTYMAYPPREEMAKHLTEINLGYEPDKKNGKKGFDWFKLVNKKGKDLEKYWLACKLTHNLGDISKIRELAYADFWTFSFPCQSISIAGKQEGIIKGETRSGLVYEVVRLIEKAKEKNTLPKYLMLENVAALVSKKFINDFNNLNEFFDHIGYNVYWSLINGKNCGVPQNRNRCFTLYIRKDIDTGNFTFPKPFDNGIRLKDILEETVDEKYYLNEDMVKKFKYCKAIVDKKNAVKQIGNISERNRSWENPQTGRIYDVRGCSPTLDTCGGGNREPKIIQVGKINSSQDGTVVATDGIAKTHTAGHNNMLKILENPEISYCLDASYYKGSSVEEYFRKKRRQIIFKKGNDSNIRIRKLTPRECWKLMGLTFDDCDKAIKIGIANIHLYKQAGNGIITNCCELLIEHLYKSQYDNSYVCYDEKFSLGQNHCDNKKSEIVGVAIRGRYTIDGGIEQQINGEDGISDAVTTVQKDSFVFENFINPPMN